MAQGRYVDGDPIPTVEVPTAASIRRDGLYLKRTPLHPLQKAASLPGKALAVYIAIRHRRDVTGKPTVALSNPFLATWGVDKDSKARALRELEAAGMARVDRTPGRNARVTLLDG